MNKFGFIKEDKTLNVALRGKSYPVTKAGSGIPCLLICLGTPTFRTLSENFSHIFEIYSSDVYWTENYALANPESVTMDTIIDDIKALGDALNLKQYVLFGHSAYGIIALEFAKKYPNVASAVIMVGTPINSNASVAQMNDEIFQKTADKKRKLIDSQRRSEIEKEDLTKLTPAQRWLREYVYRDAPRYWHIPDFDCSELWKDISVSTLLTRLFTDILPATDVLKDLEKIKEPVFLAAGMDDYDCCPWLWETIPNLPPHFIINIFNNSGHWPHYEEPQLFDSKIQQWINKIDLHR